MNKPTQTTKITFPMHPDPIINEPQMCKGLIGPGSSLGLKFIVSNDNMDLLWKIKPRNGTVKFGISRRPAKTTTENGSNFTNDIVQVEKDKIVVHCEDLSQPNEEVEPVKRIPRSKKEFAVGSVSCESGYVYTTIMTNASILLTSVTVYYCIELVKRNPTSSKIDETSNAKMSNDDCRNIHLLKDTPERKACITDLLHFVSEISMAEQQGSYLKTAKEKPKIKPKKEPQPVESEPKEVAAS